MEMVNVTVLMIHGEEHENNIKAPTCIALHVYNHTIVYQDYSGKKHWNVSQTYALMLMPGLRQHD